MDSCDPLLLLERAFRAAIAQVSGADPAGVDPQVKASADPKHGDFQCNAALGLAKAMQAKPREIAERIVAAVDLG